jgi:surfeit locus 1 family protein
MGLSRRDIAFLVFSVLAFGLLVWLGTWQVQRLQWKEDLIGRLTTQATSEPVSVAEVEARAAAGEDVEFMRATATGRFVHDNELFVFTTVDGEMGWKLVTPLDMGDTGLLVDRGFIPYDLKPPAARPESRPGGTVTVTGIVRPHGSGQALFVPDNDIDANIWHWWSLPAMAEAAGVERASPFILQAEAQPGAPAWPRASTPDPGDIPNNHLGYAITWYGLAAMLVIVNGLYIFRRRRGAP